MLHQLKKSILFLLPILFIGCKKEDVVVKPYVLVGNYSFLFDSRITDNYGNSTSGTTKFCSLSQSNGNTYLYIGGSKIGSYVASMVLEAYIKMPSNSIQVGTYSSTDIGNYLKIQSQYDSRCPCYARYVSNTANTISFKIISYNLNTREVVCEFSGKLQRENTNQTVNITNGKINGNLP